MPWSLVSKAMATPPAAAASDDEDDDSVDSSVISDMSDGEVELRDAAVGARVMIPCTDVSSYADVGGVVVSVGASNMVCVRMELNEMEIEIRADELHWELGASPPPRLRPLFESSLGRACAFGRTDAARNYLDHGTKVRRDGTRRDRAVARIHLEAARLCLDRGADVDRATVKPRDGIILCPFVGRTPLWMASKNGHLDVMRLLLDRGADVDGAIHRRGKSPLYVAIFKGRVAAAQLLLTSTGWTKLAGHRSTSHARPTTRPQRGCVSTAGRRAWYPRPRRNLLL